MLQRVNEDCCYEWWLAGERRMNLRSELALLVTGVALSCGAFADQVVMKNGDRLTGVIVKYDGKSLTMKSEFAGEVTIEWEAITSFSSTEPLNLTLKDERKLVGAVRARAGRIEVSTAEAGAVAVEKAAVRAIRNQEEEAAYQAEVKRYENPGLLQLWAGYVDLGFAATRGNAITSTFNTEFNAARATKTDKVSLYMTAIRASNTTAGVKLQTANATRGGVKYNRSVSDRWSTFGFTDLEFDEFQRLDLRVVTGGGMEYEIVKREDMAFNVQAGGSFNKEYFANNTTRKSGELVAGQSFTYKLFRITELEEKLIVYPNMTERGQYRINFDIGTITRLNKWLSFRFSVSNRYLSNPLPGNKTNDVLLSTGIRVSFAR